MNKPTTVRHKNKNKGKYCFVLRMRESKRCKNKCMVLGHGSSNNTKAMEDY